MEKIRNLEQRRREKREKWNKMENKDWRKRLVKMEIEIIETRIKMEKLKRDNK
jgi:hypothetical protein